MRQNPTVLRIAAVMDAGKPKRNALLRRTFAGMALGVLVGAVLSQIGLAPETKAGVVSGLGLVTTVFLRLIRMVVGPLVLATLISGVAQMGGAGSVGRIGIRAMVWFVAISFVAIATGLVIVNVLSPGSGLNLKDTAAVGTATEPLAPLKMVEEAVPTSIFDALAQNRVLQIVIFAIPAGLAIAAAGDRASGLRRLAEEGAAIMLKIAGYVMTIAPIAVFAALASTTLERGLGAMALLGRFVVEFYLALGVMTAWVLLAGLMFLRSRLWRLVKLMREPLLVAFSTASSEAAYPASFAALERFGASTKITSFVLPIGYAFNLAGTMVYSAFAVMFVAQSYGVAMPVATQLGVMLFLLLASKGAAGVPRGALLSLTIALQTFHLPTAGVVLILAVDALMDMGRTAINVLGNAVATASIASLEAPAALPGLRPEPEAAL